MPSVSLVTHYSKMGGTQSLLIPWRSSILMLLVGAFTMGGLYRGCVKKLRLCPSNNNNYYGYFLTIIIMGFFLLCYLLYIVAYLLSCKLLFDCFILLLRLTW